MENSTNSTDRGATTECVFPPQPVTEKRSKQTSYKVTERERTRSDALDVWIFGLWESVDEVLANQNATGDALVVAVPCLEQKFSPYSLTPSYNVVLT